MLIIAYSLFFLLAAIPLVGWFFVAVTTTGRFLAIVPLIALAAPLPILWRGRAAARRRLGLSLAAALTILLGGAVWLLAAAPAGTPPAASPVQQRFVGGGSFGRFAIGNLIPEAEQVNLGFQLMPFVDSLLTRRQAAAAARPTMAIYQAMEADANFHALGSTLDDAYLDLFGGPADRGHYYLYVPASHAEGPLPAIVFLHGSAGNFKAYTWIWSRLAEQEGYVIIAPSYGFGNWNEAGVDTVLRALNDAATVVDIDRERVYLAGLSNGGLGVAWAAADWPDRFRGLIFLSPVMNTTIVDGADFQAAWANRPVLILSGAADKRIPRTYVEQRAANLAAGGVDVTLIFYEGEDHFLFFYRPDEVLADFAAWLGANP